MSTTLATLYDAQPDPCLAPVLTTVDPASGETCSTTLLDAQDAQQVPARLRCDRLRTDLTYGMMGRLPDFMNAYLLDIKSSLSFVGKESEAPRLGAYIQRLRHEGLAVTHTLVDPQSDRSTQDAPAEALHIVERRADGVVVSGARLLSTLAPVANEVFVGSYVPRPAGQEDYALASRCPSTPRACTSCAGRPTTAGTASSTRRYLAALTRRDPDVRRGLRPDRAARRRGGSGGLQRPGRQRRRLRTAAGGGTQHRQAALPHRPRDRRGPEAQEKVGTFTWFGRSFRSP